MEDYLKHAWTSSNSLINDKESGIISYVGAVAGNVREPIGRSNMDGGDDYSDFLLDWLLTWIINQRTRSIGCVWMEGFDDFFFKSL